MSFVGIVEGEIPPVKIYEDNDVLAILDISKPPKAIPWLMPKKH